MVNFLIYAIVLISLGRTLDFFPEIAFLQLGKVVLGGGLLLACLGGADAWRELRKNPLLPCIALILCAAVFGLPFSVWRGGALEGLINYLKGLCCFITLCVLARKGHEESLRRAVVFTVGMLAVLMAVTAGVGRHHVSGSYDPNDIALFFVTFLPLVVAEALTAQSRLLRLIAWGIAGAALVGLALTQSRGGFVALAAVGAHFLLSAKRRRFSTLLLLCLGAAVFAATVDEAFWERLRILGGEGDYNIEAKAGRLEIWKDGLGMLARRPLTGVGIGQFSSALGIIGSGIYATAHNSYLQIAVELGVAGIVAYLLMLWRVARMARESIAVSPPGGATRLHGTALLLGLTGFMTGSLFLSQAYSPILYCLLATASALWAEWGASAPYGVSVAGTSSAPTSEGHVAPGAQFPVRSPRSVPGSPTAPPPTPATTRFSVPGVGGDLAARAVHVRAARENLLRKGERRRHNNGGKRP